MGDPGNPTEGGPVVVPVENPNAVEAETLDLPQNPPLGHGHVAVPLVPLAEEGVVGELVWDPVKGTHRKRAPWERRLPVEPRALAETYELLWRDPVKAKPDDRKVRLMLTSTGVLCCGVLNRWGKWLVAGYGVVDPIAYAEIQRPKPEDMPWRTP